MKIQVGVETGTSYIFHAKDANPAALMISGVDVKKDNVIAVINMTKGVVAMKCNSITPEYAIFPETNIIELYSTMSDSFEATDQFMILMEVASSVKDKALLESVHLLRKMVNLLESSGNVDTANRQRVSLDSSNVIMTVALATTGGANVTGVGYPTNYSCTAGAVNPYSITAAQPAQLVATIIDQRIDLECKMRIAADCMRTKLSWT